MVIFFSVIIEAINQNNLAKIHLDFKLLLKYSQLLDATLMKESLDFFLSKLYLALF